MNSASFQFLSFTFLTTTNERQTGLTRANLARLLCPSLSDEALEFRNSLHRPFVDPFLASPYADSYFMVSYDDEGRYGVADSPSDERMPRSHDLDDEDLGDFLEEELEFSPPEGMDPDDIDWESEDDESFSDRY